MSLTQVEKLLEKSLAHHMGAVKFCNKRNINPKPCQWHWKASKWTKKSLRKVRERMSTLYNPTSDAGVKAIICKVWGSQCSNAIRVAGCETGGAYNTTAQNGQYLGLFQMGDWARSRYGHSSTAYGQAVAAYRNYLDNGWSQWECAYIVGII